MTTMLFYNNPVLIDRETHRNLRIKPPADGYTFAASANAIPVTSAEFVSVCHEYVIVFVVTDDKISAPFAMTGLRENENFFVDGKGFWHADYIPAFVRRYPFLFQVQDTDENCLVMIDESYSGFNTESGEALFDEEGKETPMLTQMVGFLSDFKNQADHTTAFMERIVKLDLLVPRVIDVNTADGRKFTMQGFSAIDEERLAALDDASLLALARSGDLGRIHAHLLSLGNIGKLASALEKRSALPAAA